MIVFKIYYAFRPIFIRIKSSIKIENKNYLFSFSAICKITEALMTIQSNGVGQSYSLYFSGKFQNISKEQALQNFAQVFKADITKVSHFFDDKLHLIKQNLTQPEAVNYVNYFMKLGLILEIRPNLISANTQSINTQNINTQNASTQTTNIQPKAGTVISQVAPPVANVNAEEKFNLCFDGKFSSALTLETAQAAFAKLLKCSLQQAHGFFNGNKHIIKANLNHAESLQYIQLFEQLGLKAYREVISVPMQTAKQEPIQPSLMQTSSQLAPVEASSQAHASPQVPKSNNVYSAPTLISNNSDDKFGGLSFVTQTKQELDPNAKFDLVFAGKHDANILPLNARENFGRLLKCSFNRTSKYFSGDSYVIKNELSLSEANQYIQLFKSQGLIITLQEAKTKSMDLFVEAKPVHNDPFFKEEIITLEDEDESVTRFENIEWTEYKGRVDKDLYYLLSMVPIIMYFIANFIPGIMGILIAILAFWTSITITIRRLHDLNLSGWYVLVLIALWFVAIYMGINMPYIWLVFPVFSLVFGFIPGTNGENKYGAPVKLDPKLKILIYPFILFSLYNIYSEYNYFAAVSSANSFNKIMEARNMPVYALPFSDNPDEIYQAIETAKQELKKIEQWLADNPDKTIEDYGN